MNINYSDEVLKIFNGPKYFYTPGENFEYCGSAGEPKIGEYVQIYFNIIKNDNILESKITEIKFSVMGSVMLIAAAEKFCFLSRGKNIQDILILCDPHNGLVTKLNVPHNRIHSINFVIEAFYAAFQTLMNTTSKKIE